MIEGWLATHVTIARPSVPHNFANEVELAEGVYFCHAYYVLSGLSTSPAQFEVQALCSLGFWSRARVYMYTYVIGSTWYSYCTHRLTLSFMVAVRVVGKIKFTIVTL